MWKTEYHKAGAILKVLSRGHRRFKKGALKAVHKGGPAFLTEISSAPTDSVSSLPHVLPSTLIVFLPC